MAITQLKGNLILDGSIEYKDLKKVAESAATTSDLLILKDASDNLRPRGFQQAIKDVNGVLLSSSTTNYIPKFSSTANTITSSIISDNGSNIVTIGNTTTDSTLRTYYSDGSSIDIHGYGIISSRTSTYFRPTNNNNATLYIGYNAGSQNWNTVDFGATNLTLKGANIATQSWVASQGYLTSQTDSQTLTWTDATNTLAISGGNSVVLSGFADASHTHTEYLKYNPDGDGIAISYVDDNPTVNGHTLGGGHWFGADGNVANGFLAAKVQYASGMINSVGGYYVGALALTGTGGNSTQVIDGSGNWAGNVLAIGKIPTGTTSTTVALGNHTHTFASITSKPTTLSGYGITDAYTSAQTDSAISTAITTEIGGLIPSDIGAADAVHTHAISDVTGLQTALDGKLSTTGKAADSNLLDGLDSTAFLRSSGNDTYSGTASQLDIEGITAWMVSGTDNAHQRADARDDATDYARLHWYGKTAAGATSNFRHAWYDGAAYINIDVLDSNVNFYRTSGTANLQVHGNKVWHAGNDGSGSTLDADLLDGQHGSYYATSAHTHSEFVTTNIGVGDLNNAVPANGKIAYYQFSTGTANAPTSININDGVVKTTTWSSGTYAVQEAVDLDQTGFGFRYRNASGVWTSWYKNFSSLFKPTFAEIDSKPTTLSGYGITDAATSTHAHGSITNDGTISSSPITPANGDYLLISSTGYSGYINRGIAIGTSTTTYLRNDGTWATPPDTNTTYSQATSSTLGLIKLGSDTVQTTAANAVTTNASRTYALQLNASGQAVINVPWSDTNTTYSAATTSTLGLVKLGSDSVQTVLGNSPSNTAGKSYVIQNDGNGRMVVNVPWVDTNTTYSVGDGGLTEKNFTTALKTKLDGIASSANNYAFSVSTGGTPSAVLSGEIIAFASGNAITVNESYTSGTHTYTINHSDTSTQASVNNSGATVIQDVTLDTYGHVTGLASKTLSYTDVGAAASSHTHSYLPLSGGTITGPVYAYGYSDSLDMVDLVGFKRSVPFRYPSIGNVSGRISISEYIIEHEIQSYEASHNAVIGNPDIASDSIVDITVGYLQSGHDALFKFGKYGSYNDAPYDLQISGHMNASGDLYIINNSGYIPFLAGDILKIKITYYS